MKSTCPLDAHEVRLIAVKAHVDERTVRSFLREPTRVRRTLAARIAKALDQNALVPLGDDRDD